VKQIVHAQVSEDRLRRMLVAKREDVAHRLDLDAARLRRIDARLRAVEGEDSMITVDTKSLPATRVAVVTENAAGYGPQNIGPVIGPMYARLASSLVTAPTSRCVPRSRSPPTSMQARTTTSPSYPRSTSR
jgi:hypothetical protein